MKITAVGDVALAGTVEAQFTEKGVSVVDKSVRERLLTSNLLLANIECPLTDAKTPRWSYFRTLKAHKNSADLLSEIGVGVATLANNHIADYGFEGLQDTTSALEARNIRWLGAGRNLQDSLRPLVFAQNGLNIGIVTAAQPEISAAGSRQWGAAVLSEARLEEQVRNLAMQTDVVIVALHFGIEFAEYPTPSQVRLCRLLVDSGALLIFGHHPHVPQAYESYNGGFIAYSLGNFIFKMSPGPHRFSRLGLIIEADFVDNRLKNVEIVPVDTRSGFPISLDPEHLKAAKDYLAQLNLVLADEALLQEKYYFACRDNLEIHLKSLLVYGLRKLHLRRLLIWGQSQFWPQIFALRVDFVKFLFSGRAAVYEVRKRRDTQGTKTRIWLGFCKICGTIGRLLRFFGL